MKAPEFDYHRPDTLDAALALLSKEDVVPLAGGQSLMPMMNFRIARPEALVDLNGIPGLSEITTDEGSVRIGAMTRYEMLEKSTDIQRDLPLITRALPHIAHSAIRNRGTIGGSCALADPAAEMPALMLALGAEFETLSHTGSRRVAADDFFLGLYETALDETEIIHRIHVPVRRDQRIGFHEITRRHGDYAMAGCAVVADAALKRVRIAFFGVSDRAIRAEGAEAALAQSDGGDAALAAAIAALDDLDVEGDLHCSAAMKSHLAGVALGRAWAEVMS